MWYPNWHVGCRSLAGSEIEFRFTTSARKLGNYDSRGLLHAGGSDVRSSVNGLLQCCKPRTFPVVRQLEQRTINNLMNVDEQSSSTWNKEATTDELLSPFTQRFFEKHLLTTVVSSGELQWRHRSKLNVISLTPRVIWFCCLLKAPLPPFSAMPSLMIKISLSYVNSCRLQLWKSWCLSSRWSRLRQNKKKASEKFSQLKYKLNFCGRTSWRDSSWCEPPVGKNLIQINI